MGFDPERYASHHRESNRRERERIRESSRSALDGGDVYKAMEIAEEYPWKVDIADMRLIPEHVRSRIEKSGKVLRERGSIRCSYVPPAFDHPILRTSSISRSGVQTIVSRPIG